MLEKIISAVEKFNEIGMSIFWHNVNFFSETNVPAILLLGFIGCMYFMFRLRLNCITHFVHGFRLLLGSGGHGSTSKPEEKQSISSFRALFTSIAGAAGLGNIAGIAIGVSIGGPGVVFWILVASIICMPLRFAEVYLGHKYRRLENGEHQGGPYWYMKYGLEKLGLGRFGSFLAMSYGIILIVSAYGGPSSFQTNQAVKVFAESFNLPEYGRYIASAVLSGFVFFITIGGIRRVGHYCSSAVMFFMSIYLILCIAVLGYYHDRVWDCVKVVMLFAFNYSSFYGGVIAVFIMAFQRLQLANETGFGTAASIHSNSTQENSVKEALIAMICPVIDAVFVCFVTGVIIVISGSAAKQGLEGIMVVQDALKSVHPLLGYFLTFSIPLVAINVMIAWSYYGVKNLEFILKTKKFSVVYLASFALAGFVGGIIDNLKIFVDFCNVLSFALLLPNVIAVLLLRKEVLSAWNEYSLNIRYKNDKN
ncbi:alanine/glycine:cation symporter family protein [Candidatus Deianiraea vastatrix]|uniref:Amino acid carrier family protein n=1 Tax=Candidatus Deianiraea vastatrix TaxID=2163644 RepID=A0A5B8XF66_9RICK|nr:alanine:cation symporter family protein [Candidatus Deianiraea vastatrix]QED23626.1 Putative amino acid carrier family protein [Candidatus Deianiraea vastatrix]